MQGYSISAEYIAGFKDKRKSQEAKQSLSEKENLEEPGKKRLKMRICGLPFY